MLRDTGTRARAPHTIAAQFFANVRPMHKLHVEPQRAYADLVLTSTEDADPTHAEADAERIMRLLTPLP